MLELFLCLKYLIPRRKSLSTFIISFMSIIVISVVIWLILVFFSITSGIEKRWINNLISINSTMKVVPSKHYYSSYFYNVDTLSNDSNFSYKNIKEKLITTNSDPYQIQKDMPIPTYWPLPKYDKSRNFIDPVKAVYSILNKPNQNTLITAFQDYELAISLIQMEVDKNNKNIFENQKNYINQMIYLLSYSSDNPYLENMLCPYSDSEINVLKNIFKDDFNKNNVKDIIKKYLISSDLANYSILLPKNFKDIGAKIGDNATLSYVCKTPLAMQEQKVNVHIIGFYETGPIPIGGKALITSPDLISLINSSSISIAYNDFSNNGINIWVKDLNNVDLLKSNIEKELKEKEVDGYWEILTYKEFEFVKDLLQQFQSDKTLFLLIGIIILLVSCSNIISFLIILVNDKKKEIAVLQAIGASKKSIIITFGLTGFCIGFCSFLIGSFFAIITLKNIHIILNFLSYMQGNQFLNPLFFNNSCPNQLNFKYLGLIFIATIFISIFASIIPALKASKLHPSKILRAE